MWGVIKKNPISTFAVLLVAVVCAYLFYMSFWQTTILTSPDWCQRAMRAEQIAPGTTYEQALAALKSCNALQAIQLNAVALDSHIDHGTFSVIIIVLIVVVIAGARASWKVGPTGLEGTVSRDDPGDDAVPVKVVNPPGSPVPTAETKLPPMAPKP